MDDEFEPYEVSYETIFNHLNYEGKFISFELSHSMEYILKENSYYIKYCEEKVKFRHTLEAKYKLDYEKIHPGYFRPFLDAINDKKVLIKKALKKKVKR